MSAFSLNNMLVCCLVEQCHQLLHRVGVEMMMRMRLNSETPLNECMFIEQNVGALSCRAMSLVTPWYGRRHDNAVKPRETIK